MQNDETPDRGRGLSADSGETVAEFIERTARETRAHHEQHEASLANDPVPGITRVHTHCYEELLGERNALRAAGEALQTATQSLLIASIQYRGTEATTDEQDAAFKALSEFQAAAMIPFHR